MKRRLTHHGLMTRKDAGSQTFTQKRVVVNIIHHYLIETDIEHLTNRYNCRIAVHFRTIGQRSCRHEELNCDLGDLGSTRIRLQWPA